MWGLKIQRRWGGVGLPWEAPGARAPSEEQLCVGRRASWPGSPGRRLHSVRLCRGARAGPVGSSSSRGTCSGQGLFLHRGGGSVSVKSQFSLAWHGVGVH